MSKLFPPTLLATCDEITREFYLQRQISDISSLKYHLQNSVCLAVDLEGCEAVGKGISSIGLAILPPNSSANQSKAFQSLPFETHEIVSDYKIEASCIYLEDRRRNRPYPTFLHGNIIKTTREGAGQEIQAIIERTKQLKKDIILVGWHPHPSDLPGLQALLPEIFHEMTGWVDVLDVTRQMCVSKQEDLTKTWPPLGDVLLSAGLSATCLPQRYHHSAGNDAIHTMALLLRLLTHSDPSSPLEVKRRRQLKQWKMQQDES